MSEHEFSAAQLAAYLRSKGWQICGPSTADDDWHFFARPDVAGWISFLKDGAVAPETHKEFLHKALLSLGMIEQRPTVAVAADIAAMGDKGGRPAGEASAMRLAPGETIVHGQYKSGLGPASVGNGRDISTIEAVGKWVHELGGNLLVVAGLPFGGGMAKWPYGLDGAWEDVKNTPDGFWARRWAEAILWALDQHGGFATPELKELSYENVAREQEMMRQREEAEAERDAARRQIHDLTAQLAGVTQQGAAAEMERDKLRDDRAEWQPLDIRGHHVKLEPAEPDADATEGEAMAKVDAARREWETARETRLSTFPDPRQAHITVNVLHNEAIAAGALILALDAYVAVLKRKIRDDEYITYPPQPERLVREADVESPDDESVQAYAVVDRLCDKLRANERGFELAKRLIAALERDAGLGHNAMAPGVWAAYRAWREWVDKQGNDDDHS